VLWRGVGHGPEALAKAFAFSDLSFLTCCTTGASWCQGSQRPWPFVQRFGGSEGGWSRGPGTEHTETLVLDLGKSELTVLTVAAFPEHLLCASCCVRSWGQGMQLWSPTQGSHWMCDTDARRKPGVLRHFKQTQSENLDVSKRNLRLFISQNNPQAGTLQQMLQAFESGAGASLCPSALCSQAPCSFFSTLPCAGALGQGVASLVSAHS
jgi:hypothetical protein